MELLLESIVYKYLNNNNKAYVFIPFIVNAKKKYKLDTTIEQSTGQTNN